MKKIYFILVCSFFLVQCEPGWIWKIGDDIVESYNQEENVYCIETSACNYNYHNSYYGSEGCVYPNILVPSECDNLCLTYSDSLCVLNCSSNDDLVLSCNDYNIIRNILTMNNDSLNPFYVVDLNNNELELDDIDTLTDDIGNLQYITDLQIKSSSLSYLPSSITKIQNLERLSLDMPKLSLLPETINELVNLNRLNIQSDSLISLPENIGTLELSRLEIQSSGDSTFAINFTQLPSSITSMQNLNYLSIDNTSLSSLPSDLSSLINLNTLYVQNNKISSLPQDIGSMNLDQVNFSNNYLKSLPESICNFKINNQDFSYNLTGNCLTEEYISSMSCDIISPWCEPSCDINEYNTNCDCNAVPDGTSITDNCGNCLFTFQVNEDGSSSSCEKDCYGIWGGISKDEDNDGVCDELQGTVTDIDGNIYKTVMLGDQNWMAENLRVTKFNNGDEILNDTSYSSLPVFHSLQNPPLGDYSYYNTITNSAQSFLISPFIELFGNYYNNQTVDDERNVCPEGWHIPTDTEWYSLTTYVENECCDDNNSNCSRCLLSNKNNLWPESYEPTNSSGLSILPSGWTEVHSNGLKSVGGFGYEAVFWSDEEYPKGFTHYNYSSYFNESSGPFDYYRYPIRCVKDN